MKINIKEKIDELILGSTFLGTGGGGKPDVARKLYSFVDLIDLKKIQEMKDTDIFITAFGVGPSSQGGNPEIYIKKGFNMFKKYIKEDIAGIIPVEIGPASLATAIYFASVLHLPVIDADFVGGRSAPEIFLETISLFNIQRTPLVAISENENYLILDKIISYEEIEKQVRDFSASEGVKIYIIGYPVTKKNIFGKIEEGTITEALNLGSVIKDKSVLLLEKSKVLYTGIITEIQEEIRGGFIIKNIFLNNKNDTARIFTKNEFLGFWINSVLVLSCPDLIVLADEKQALYNTDLFVGQKINVVGYKSRALWRSVEGIKLFNPKLFGFSNREKLL